MKKTNRLCLDAALVALMAGTALQAQADAEFYGQGSIGYYSAQGMTAADKSLSGISDQPKSDNRWGLRGKENLGGGLSVLWQLESNFSLRNGASGNFSTSAAGATGASKLLLFRQDAVYWRQPDHPAVTAIAVQRLPT